MSSCIEYIHAKRIKGRGGLTGMDLHTSLFLNAHYQDTMASFWSDKDTVAKWEENMNRENRKEKCDQAIIRLPCIHSVYTITAGGDNYMR